MFGPLGPSASGPISRPSRRLTSTGRWSVASSRGCRGDRPRRARAARLSEVASGVRRNCPPADTGSGGTPPAGHGPMRDRPVVAAQRSHRAGSRPGPRDTADFAGAMPQPSCRVRGDADPRLGHARLHFATIYAKLDREPLATIALPWHVLQDFGEHLERCGHDIPVAQEWASASTESQHLRRLSLVLGFPRPLTGGLRHPDVVDIHCLYPQQRVPVADLRLLRAGRQPAGAAASRRESAAWEGTMWHTTMMNRRSGTQRCNAPRAFWRMTASFPVAGQRTKRLAVPAGSTWFAPRNMLYINDLGR